MMDPEGNSLDLNNLPEDYFRDGKQTSGQDTSSVTGIVAAGGASRKKKNGGGNQREPPNKVYECRFCSLKFCKSQALGGHMNRHRQERETETLNKARQLVFTNDLVYPAAAAHLGYVSSAAPGGDGALPMRSMYPQRPQLFPTSASVSQRPRPVYTSTSRVLSFPATSQHDYFLGHVIPPHAIHAEGKNYTCVGAPVGTQLPTSGGVGTDGAWRSEEEVQLNWGSIRR